MMEGARVLVQMICALAALKLGSATERPTLLVSYLRNSQSYVTLACVDDSRNTLLSHSVFMKDGAPLTSGPASDQVTTIQSVNNGIVEFYFTQAQEGVFACVHNNRTSQKIGLAGIMKF